MSPKAREMSAALIDGIYAQLVDGLASGRSLSGEKVRALFDKAPGTPEELVAAGLADAVGDKKEALASAGLAGANEVDAATYQRVDPRSLGLRNGPQIALVFGDGAIVPRALRAASASQFAADEVGEALEAAAKDDSIRAVVLRINSPGGDAMASDLLWRAVKQRAREEAGRGLDGRLRGVGRLLHRERRQRDPLAARDADRLDRRVHAAAGVRGALRQARHRARADRARRPRVGRAAATAR